jgi:hypothetical protein
MWGALCDCSVQLLLDLHITIIVGSVAQDIWDSRSLESKVPVFPFIRLGSGFHPLRPLKVIPSSHLWNSCSQHSLGKVSVLRHPFSSVLWRGTTCTVPRKRICHRSLAPLFRCFICHVTVYLVDCLETSGIKLRKDVHDLFVSWWTWL